MGGGDHVNPPSYLRSCSLNTSGVIVALSKAWRLSAAGLYLSYPTTASVINAIALASSLGPGYARGQRDLFECPILCT